ncbi:MAG: aminopeptidase P family protein, partial [Deltaproteobacteria bacterium]|nr:aminopeptidase P family protein [Deltaproteobacteria bacterium]
MIRQRIVKLQASLRRRKLDAILITEPQNRQYLSGYSAVDHGIQETSGVLLIPVKGTPYLLTDSRFVLQAEEEAIGYTVELYPKGIYACLKRLLPKLGLKRLGFESHYFLHASVAKMEKMAKTIDVKLVPLTQVVERMRVIKSNDEIQALKKSVLLNERVFQLVYNTIEPGMTEIEIGLALELTMRELGAEGPSFDTIVAFGTNAARPHAVPTDRVLKSGDIV